MLPEDVEAALVGALGELRQFSFSWFKKGQNQQKNSSQGPEGSGSGLALLRGSAWTLHAPRWERSPSLPTETRNLQPNPGSVKKGTLGLFRVRGGSGSCQRHGKRGAGRRAAASSPSQRRHSDWSQPCESLSKRWEPRWWRCHWAGPWGAPRGNPLPPCPRPPPSAPTSLGTGLSPGRARFPFASRRNAGSEREVLV